MLGYEISQDGQPTIAVSSFRGYSIRLVAGYDIDTDGYTVHVYVKSDPNADEVHVNKVTELRDLDTALQAGCNAAERHIRAQ